MLRKRDHIKQAGQMRLFNETTGNHLHLSGAGEVKTELYAWRGTRQQAEKLRKSADDWPYALVSILPPAWGADMGVPS